MLGSPPPTVNPFYFGGKINDPTRFVGRKSELRFITQRMEGTQMTSVGIVGPRRIGKSSLLFHVYQTYPQRLRDSHRFLVAYVSLQDARVRTQTSFLQTISVEFAQLHSRRTAASIQPSWTMPCSDLITLDRNLRAMHDADLRCVLCLDEFEALLEKPNEFDDGFYDALRTWMDDQLLMLIVASARPLTYYGGRYRFVSRFFNLGNTTYLEEFDEDEVRALITIPAVSNGSPALGMHDQSLARKLGGRHPYYLQMAAYYIYEAQVSSQDEQWVQKQFRRQSDSQRYPFQRTLQRMAGWLWQAPAWLGRAAGKIGAAWDNLQNVIVGALIILVLLLFVFGSLNAQEVFQWIATFLGLGQVQP